MPAVDTPAPSRFVGVDAARGLALIGMMAVHVLPGKDGDGTRSLPYDIALGRSAATFAVLAGVGLALATRRGRGFWPAAVSIAVRALLIGAIGLALGAAPSGVAAILTYYAVLFLLAIPLLRLPVWLLALLAVLIAVVVPVVSQAIRDGDAVPFAGANPTFATLVDSPVLLIQTLALLGYYPALPWMAYVCAGLAAGRLALGNRRVAAGILAVGVVLAVAAPIASRVLLDAGGRRAIGASATAHEYVAMVERHKQFGNTPTGTWWWLAVDAPHSSTPPDLIHTTGVALALLGLMLLLASVLPRGVLAPVAAAGSMTLTVYTAHLLMLASGRLPDDPETSFLVQVLAVLVLALAWRRYVGRGPIEHLVATVSAAAARRVPGRIR